MILEHIDVEYLVIFGLILKDTSCIFLLAARDLLYTRPLTDRTAHTMAFDAPVVVHWLKKKIMDTLRWLDPA